MRDLLDMMGISAVRGTYQIKGEREETCRVCGPDLEAMTYAMQRLKVWEIPYIYNTKLGVSPTLLEPEHATPSPANDVTKQPVVSAAAIASLQEIAEPVSHAMFSADVFMAQLAGQGIHPRLMPTARALANEAWCLVKPFIETSHISRSAGEIWLPISNEIGFQVSLNIPIPDFMEGTGESLYPVEHGADIVFPFDIDLSARQINLRRVMKSSLAIRALKANHSPKAAKALLDDLLAA